ncbi:hypothetical protein ACFL01_01435 [Planctomycetota bacterium]
MTQYKNTLIRVAVPTALIFVAVCALAGEERPGPLEIIPSPSASPGEWDLTRIKFAVQGPYAGRIEFSQVKTVRFLQDISHRSDSRVEYQVALPAVFDDIPYKVVVGSSAPEAESHVMQYVSAHDAKLERIFGSPLPSRAVKIKAILIAVLYVVCVSQLLRLKPAGRCMLAAAIATIAFSAAEVLLVRNRVEERSVTLHEGRAGGGSCSYEFIGVGSPWGGMTTLHRDRGVVFPIRRTVQDLFGENLEVKLTGKGSSVEDLRIERGTWRTFCCIVPGGLEGELAGTHGNVTNRTNLDMRGFLYAGGQLLDLGDLGQAGRARIEGAARVSKAELLGEARECLAPPALALCAWRIDQLGSVDTVIGLVPPFQLVFFEISNNADVE